MTQETEQALRELIDYDDELAMFTNRLEVVIQALGNAPAPQHTGRRPRVNADGEGDSDDPEDQEPEEAVPVIAPSDIYKRALTEYEREYRSKSMRARYDINDYKNFKRVVHDAQHPEENAPPMLVPEDFSLDKVIMRQVKRAQEIEARGEDPDEDDDEDAAPRGTQSTRPQELESDDDDEEEDVPARVSRVKQERATSRAPMGGRGRPADDSDIEMDD
ncbi:hypothetical protein M7I_5235 [Glarea lozoyensis 74030]|uniref:Uncharacterized protein n=1 Tax=Glarea lozoyensis (strain ATCC 74030 / MF5533) TaxID=1104152 RepID=H0ERB6_GLAL7|nr:hypothetical protein M7I_5235 [Glarea lozoyensis 74030]